MSHFPVLVISNGIKTVEQLLAQFNENIEALPHSMLEFDDETAELMDDWNNGTSTMFRDQIGQMFHANAKEPPEGHKAIEVANKELFASIEAFAEWQCYEASGDGRFGCWRNPNAKWDWWKVGGRWAHALRVWSRERVDTAPMHEIDTGRDHGAFERARMQWHQKFSGEKPHGRFDSFELEVYSLEGLIEKFGDADTYAMFQDDFWFHAVITPEGDWHEVGPMGWFGISDWAAEDIRKWVSMFRRRFVIPYRDCTATVVDCHI